MAVHNLPHYATPFVGRVAAITEITKRLNDPDCRLLTLVGPGGIGKTRLAIEVAKRCDQQFADGVYFIPFQPLNSPDFMVSAIADSLCFQFHPGSDPKQQLLDYLRDRYVFIILDNFEHLLSGTDLLSDILATAPDVKMLVTSRHTLNIREEWVWVVEGLPCPEGNTSEKIDAHDAMQLFAQCASRVRQDFSLIREQEYVREICQLVEGLPLALELAASWTKVLLCQTIKEEITRSFDFLTTDLHNIPERHRSINAVFEQTWQLLTDEERIVFQCLSVFCGGFYVEAAQQVAGANIRMLARLSDKSLIRLDSSGRYQMHELVRQYAQQRLSENQAEMEASSSRHCCYYTNFLHNLEGEVYTANRAETLRKVGVELNNIRAAWSFAVKQTDLESLWKANITLFEFFDARGQFQEALETFGAATHTLSTTTMDGLTGGVLGLFYNSVGWLSIRTGQYAQAEQALKQSLFCFENDKTAPPHGLATDPILGLGLLALLRCNYDEAIQFCERGRQNQQARADLHNLQVAHYILADTYCAQGQHEQAHDHACRAQTFAQATGNLYMMAYILISLGNIECARNQLNQAQNYYQESYAIKQSLGEPEGTAVALNRLGDIAYLKREYDKAAQLFGQAEGIYRQLSDHGGLATALHGLGKSTLQSQDYATSQDYLSQALDIAASIQWIPLMLNILIDTGRLLACTNERELSIEVLSTVAHYPSANEFVLREARRLLAETVLSGMSQPRITSDLNAIALAVQRKLGTPELLTSPYPETPAAACSLSPRELEVLRLLAEGYSNHEIAERLVVTIGTVKDHLYNIYQKLGVHNRTRAIAHARQLRLLP